MLALASGGFLACTPLSGTLPLPDASADSSQSPGDADRNDAPMDRPADGASDAATGLDRPPFPADGASSFCPPTSATPGALDREHSGEVSGLGLNVLHLSGLAVDGRGRAYAIGAANGCANPTATDSDGVVARFTADGALDLDWGVDGLACVGMSVGGEALDEVLFAGAIDARGRLVVVGGELRRGVLSAGLVARFTESGARDDTFDGDGVVQVASPARALPAMFLHDVLVDGGRVVVAASNASVSSVATFGAAVALRDDGTLDTSFHGTGFWIDDQVAGYHTLARHEDGYALVGVTPKGLQPRVARLRTNGELDTSWGAGGYARIAALDHFAERSATTDARGNLYVGGGQYLDGVGWHFGVVARLDRAGHVDPTWGLEGIYRTRLYWEAAYQLARGFALDCEGRLLVVGTAADNTVRLQRLTVDGALDRSFGMAGGAILDAPSTAGGHRGAPQVVLDPRGATVSTGRTDSHTIGVWRYAL